MPQYSLTEYTTKIAEQLANGQVQEAIAHCRHILSHYPQYLPAYKLLAQACLEQGDHAQANNFYQAVLSANPEDADAWMNLALLSKDLDELEQATWLMERAFEIDPGNSEIREQLRQLYSRRDGVERTRIKLTPAALARQFAKGGAFGRAVRRLRKILDASPDLPPLQVAVLEVTLAEALWHQSGKAAQAQQVCESLLEKLPTCLQANLIQGQILSSMGRTQEAKPCLSTAQRLDPEGQFAHGLLGDQSPLPLTRVEISYLEYQEAEVAEAQPATTEAEDSEWLDQISEGVEALSQDTESEPPDWLKNWDEQESLASSALAAGAIAAGVASEDQEPASPETPEPDQDSETAVPDWLLEIQQEGQIEPGQEDAVPEWLQAVDQADEGEAMPESAVESPAKEQELEWLQELGPAPAAETPPETAGEPSALEEDLPAWLVELSHETETDADLGSEAELPDWVREAEAQAPLEPTRAEYVPLTEPPGPTAETTTPEQGAEAADWLDELREEAKAAAPTEAAIEPLADDEVPEWLRELSPEGEGQAPLGQAEPPPPLERAPKEELPDWLQDLEVEASGVESPILPLAAAAALASKPTSRAEEPPLEMESKEEPPDWLRELGGEAIPESATEAIAEPSLDEELPDWLQELNPEAEAEALLTATDEPAAAVSETQIEPTPEEEIPDWLQELRTQTEVEEDLAVVEPEAQLPPLAKVAAAAGLAAKAPDWLERLGPDDQFQAAEGEERLPAMEAPQGPIEEPVEAALLPAPVEGMPDWLVELESELQGAMVAPQPVPESLAPPETAPVETAPLRAPQGPEEAEVEAITEVPPTEPVPEPVAQETPLSMPVEPALAAAGALALDQEELPEWSADLDQEPVPTVTVEEMPEWLDQLHAPEPEGATEAEPTPSVESLEWLQELEQAPAAGIKEIEKEPVAAPPEPELATVEEPPAYAVEPAPEPASDAREMPVTQAVSARLASAREYLRNRAFGDSAREYEQLVQVPELREELIQELEETVSEHPDHYELHEVLGDAYVHGGQLQKALQAYKEALSKL
jgi:tetratricopeptide (TPR) repeat protein